MILHTVVAHILTRAANILLSGGQKQSFEGNIIMVFDKQYLELIQYKTLIGMILYRTVFLEQASLYNIFSKVSQILKLST